MLCEYCNSLDINMVEALSLLESYMLLDKSVGVPRDTVRREFRAIYGNDESASYAVERITGRNQERFVPAGRVVRELERLLCCIGHGKTLLDG